MTIDIHDDTLLKRFLVGEVTAEERERIEDAFMADDSFYDEVRAIEDELFLDHLRGVLAPEWEEPLVRAIEASPVRQRRVDEMRALLDILPAPAPAAASPPRHTRVSRPALGALAAAAVLALGVGGIYRLRAPRAPEAIVSEAAPPAVSRDVRAPIDVVLALRPIVRSAQPADNTFSIPTGTDTVTLAFSMVLEPRERPAFALAQDGGPPVPVSTSPVLQRDGDRRVAVRWTMPAGLLPAGEYLLTVTADAGNGPRERLTRRFAIAP